jgi:putative exporter of polyketide antibiotics
VRVCTIVRTHRTPVAQEASEYLCSVPATSRARLECPMTRIIISSLFAAFFMGCGLTAKTSGDTAAVQSGDTASNQAGDTATAR